MAPHGHGGEHQKDLGHHNQQPSQQEGQQKVQEFIRSFDDAIKDAGTRVFANINDMLEYWRTGSQAILDKQTAVVPYDASQQHQGNQEVRNKLIDILVPTANASTGAYVTQPSWIDTTDLSELLNCTIPISLNQKTSLFCISPLQINHF